MYMKVIVFLIACLSVYCTADEIQVNWDDCGSTVGEIKNVEVIGCEDTSRCPLKRGTNASLKITFVPSVSSETLNATVYGKLIGPKIRFDLPNPDSCHGLGITCPIQPSVTYVYSNTIEVKTIYPKVTVDIYWELKDDNGDLVVCALIPARLV